ncbi:MAG: hypothetical protein B7Y98_13075 [Sphingomonas sp. 32-62-10]|nr:MAG: hypothetical protein B7Z43_08580 [Sphingomonas sp. 12-62-6]OYX37222.1 MAG: hypothetical protein B7Y98_13075 [Sphingomonas sp. 32-62-10]OYY65086.1 MAG: hypothetical protein B7Y49_07275 [Sphingomonas sp. 28-62-11]
MAANWRVAMFGVANMFLATQRAFSAGKVAISPTEMLIYLTVCVANVQKLMRERTVPENFTATAILPREWVIPISRNAIASATGLPRETVRRQVEKMIERGLLIEDCRGGVTPPPGVIDILGLEPMLEPILAEFTKTAEQLARVGVIEIHDD